MKELIIVSGPTAAGKSSVSVELAKKISGEIISADSMQVYRRMDIGTAKLSSEKMQGIPHHMIDILDPSQDFNVADFKARADELIAKIRSGGRIPIIAGGTGFYTQAVLYGVDFNDDETDEAVRKRIAGEAEKYGIEYISKKLEDEDPVSAGKYKGNLKRMIRALEYKELTGKKLSDKNEAEAGKEKVYDAVHFCLTMPREILYERINKRVDKMLEEGLLDEVKRLKEEGISRDKNSMQALGYKQLLAYLYGEVSYDEAVENIKKETRHFAKRQITWFKGRKDIVFIDRSSFESDLDTADEMVRIINGKGEV